MFDYKVLKTYKIDIFFDYLERDVRQRRKPKKETPCKFYRRRKCNRGENCEFKHEKVTQISGRKRRTRHFGSSSRAGKRVKMGTNIAKAVRKDVLSKGDSKIIESMAKLVQLLDK